MKKIKSKRRRRPDVPASAPRVPDWRTAEAAGQAWAGLRITEDDLDRVADFLVTGRAPRLHGELVAFQAGLLQALEVFDWTEIDAATLLGLMSIATHLHVAHDRGFPPGTADRRAERWLTILYRLILAAEDGGLEPLALAREAMTASLSYSHGASKELVARMARHLGADAVGAVLHRELTGHQADDLARAALRHVRQATEKQVPEPLLSRLRQSEPEEITSAIFEEIARRLRGRHRLDDLMDAMVEAMPPGRDTPSRWDYVAQDAANRVRRAHKRDLPPQPGPETERADKGIEYPDEIVALYDLIDEIKANPKFAVALEAVTTKQPRRTVASRAGVSTRTLQDYIASLRHRLE